MTGPISTETMFCSNNQSCSLSGTCANVNQTGCSEQELVIRANGKSSGELLKHKDVIFLVRAVAMQEEFIFSFYSFNCTRNGSCDLELLCKGLTITACEHLAMKFNLLKY